MQNHAALVCIQTDLKWVQFLCSLLISVQGIHQQLNGLKKEIQDKGFISLFYHIVIETGDRKECESISRRAVRELSELIKNTLICVPKNNEGLTGLEQHEGEYLMT